MMINTLGKIVLIFLITTYLNATDTFTIKLSKTEAFVNEPIKVTLTLKYSINDPIIKTNFDEFIAEDFLIKELDTDEPIKKDNSFYQYFHYMVFPKTAGDIKINKQKIRIAKREAKTNLIIWTTLTSKGRIIKASPLPDNIDIVGNYTINTTIDKKSYKAHQPINLTLQIDGTGNIDDIEQFKLDLKNQLFFTDKPIIKSEFKDGQYKGQYIQKFSIIAQDSFTIKPIVFKYFNSDTKMIEQLETKAIKVSVEATKVSNTNDNESIKYIYALIGFIIGLATIYIFKLLRNNIKKEPTLLQVKIKQTKNDKELYNILLPYAQNYNLHNLMKKLEDNIYNGAKNKINKNNIIKIFDESN